MIHTDTHPLPTEGQKDDTFPGLLANLVYKRHYAAFAVGLALFFVLTTGLGVSLWSCPLAGALHQPCPGCGLTRASVLLVQGQVAESLAMHAFAPAALTILGGCVVSLCLSKSGRTHLARRVARADGRFGVSFWGLIGLVAYWIIRLAIGLGPAMG